MSVDGSLYSGTAGIGRFLAYLWAFTHDERYRDTATGALEQSFALAGREPAEARAGLFTGVLGAACVAVEAARLVGDEELATRGVAVGAHALAERVAAAHRSDFDLIQGTAGTLVASACLAAAAPTSSAREACRALADDLIAAARTHPWGLSWPDPVSGVEGMCGLAHGGSGAILALLEASRVTGDPAHRRAAAEALRYEHAWFDRSSGSWLSCPPGEADAETHPAASPGFWCHGAAGIGLARLRGHELAGDLIYVAEAGAALRAVAPILQRCRDGAWSSDDSAADGNASVCHGACSAIELFVHAAGVLDQPVLLERARDAMRGLLAIVERGQGRWRCGVPGGDEHPGLMLGLAGIGLCLLRLHAPASVPPASLVGVSEGFGLSR